MVHCVVTSTSTQGFTRASVLPRFMRELEQAVDGVKAEVTFTLLTLSLITVLAFQ